MGENERLGARFYIDVTDLKAGLAQANRLIKESNSEFKAAAAGMDDWTKSEEGLNAKKKQLNDTLKIQNTVLAAYEQQMKDAGYAEDDMSRAAVELRTKINNQKAAIAGTEKSIRDMDSALDALRNASDDAEDSLEDVGNAARDAGDNFTIAKGAAADLVARGISTLANSAKNLIGNLASLSQETQEYREDMGKLKTAFETAGKSTEEATKVYEDFYTVLGEEDRSVEAVNHLAKFVETEKDMAKWTDICAGVWGAYGDSLPIEGLTEASNETAKTGKLTGVLTDALNWAGLSEEKFQESLDKCNNESERASLITNTLNGLYEESAENYKKNNEQIMEARKATSEFKKAQAELGHAIEPLTTEFTKLKTKGLQWLVDEGLPLAKEGFNWIKENSGVIEAGIAAIGTAFLTFKVVGIITAVTKALEGMTLAQAALNFVMSINPIGLVIAAIAGLVAGFIVLWKRCDGFRNFWFELWDGIKNKVEWAWTGIENVFSVVGTWFKDKFKEAYKAVTDIFDKLPKFFSGLWESVKTTFVGLGTKIGSAIGGAVKSAINAVIGLIENRINSAIGLINGAISLINKIPKVHVDSVKTLSLPRLAEGGIVSRATTAVIGEDGKEAIVPLERNTEWIDKVADKIATKTGGGIVVNQTNNYSQAHSRYEIYKSKQQTAAAVRLALGR